MAGRIGAVHADTVAAMVRAIQVPAVFGEDLAERLVAGAVLGHAVQPDQGAQRFAGEPFVHADGVAVGGADNKAIRSHGLTGSLKEC